MGHCTSSDPSRPCRVPRLRTIGGLPALVTIRAENEATEPPVTSSTIFPRILIDVPFVAATAGSAALLLERLAKHRNSPKTIAAARCAWRIGRPLLWRFVDRNDSGT